MAADAMDDKAAAHGPTYKNKMATLVENKDFQNKEHLTKILPGGTAGQQHINVI